jgi:hypothetical protein
MFPVGSKLSGTTWTSRFASGTIKEVYPGIGFLVEKDLYTYIIIDNFKVEDKAMNHHIDTPSSESSYVDISNKTLMIWLMDGEPAKKKIYGIELREKSLINPMSLKGLSLSFKVAPHIMPRDDLMSLSSEILYYYVCTGIMPSCERGDHAPLPLELMRTKEEEYQMNNWHLLRAQHGITNGFAYHFLDCGKKLRVEANGAKLFVINYNLNGVLKSTPYSSPVFACVKMASPPHVLDEIPELEEGEIGNKKIIASLKWNLYRLSDKELDEGIEAAYWEMRRIRENPNWADDPSFIHSMEWTDAAWDEVQFRRDMYV